MKQTKTLAAITIAVSMFLLSCNSGGSNTAATPVPDTTVAKPAAPAMPTNLLIVKHKVADYAKWKPIYDGDDSNRVANGLHSFIIGRGMDDSNMVILIMKMDDVNKAKEFGASPALQAAMQKAGVISKPEMYPLDIVMMDTTTISQTARVMVVSKVKDFDAWKKVFDGDKQARMDAGLIDRGVAQDDSDKNMVSLVFAITDMDKTKTFMKSKDLKDKMDKAGVVGPPSFFFYNIVEKY